jgi:hypothetical protein
MNSKLVVGTGLPDGTFSYQKFKFWYIPRGLDLKFLELNNNSIVFFCQKFLEMHLFRFSTNNYYLLILVKKSGNPGQGISCFVKESEDRRKALQENGSAGFFPKN